VTQASVSLLDAARRDAVDEVPLYHPKSTPPVVPIPMDARFWAMASYSGSTHSPTRLPHGQNMKSSATSPPK